MNEQLLKNIWDQLTRDGKTTSSFEEWVVNVSNDPSVQQTIHGYWLTKNLQTVLLMIGLTTQV